MKIIKAFFLILITAVFLAFAIANREFVSLSLFPIPYTVELPKFLLALVCIIVGAILGWVAVSIRLSKNYLAMKSGHKRVLALQNELSSLHAEKNESMSALSPPL